MAGYSGTPLARKLGIKAGATLLCMNAPAELEAWLAPLPLDVVQVQPPAAAGTVDVAVLFTTAAAELEAALPSLLPCLRPAGGLWVGWPKQAARVPTDLDGNRVRALGLETGLVDNKVCAISDVWSGLRFVRRLRDR